MGDNINFLCHLLQAEQSCMLWDEGYTRLVLFAGDSAGRFVKEAPIANAKVVQSLFSINILL